MRWKFDELAGVDASQLIEGATLVGAVAAVEALVGGAQPLSF